MPVTDPAGLLGNKVPERDDPIKATSVISCGARAEGVDLTSAGADGAGACAGAADSFVVEGSGHMVWW